MKRPALLVGCLALCLLLPAAGVRAQAVVPEVPTIGTVSSGDDSLTIPWSAPPSDGGSPISNYDLRYILSDAESKADDDWTLKEGIWSAGALSHVLTGLTKDTSYDLRVRAVNVNGAGGWSDVSTEATNDHGDSRASATAIGVGASVAGRIDPGGDTDYFTITVSESTDLWVYTTGPTDTVGELTNQSGGSIASNNDRAVPGSTLNFSLQAIVSGGTYYIKVDGNRDSTMGPYTLHVRAAAIPGNSFESATTVALDASTPGRTADGASDTYFTFELEERSEVWISTTGPLDTVVAIWSRDTMQGEPVRIDRNDDGLIEGNYFGSLIIGTLDAGTYYVVVSKFSYARHDWFTLHVHLVEEAGSTPETAAPARVHFLTSGSSASTTDHQYYRITITDPTWARVYAQETSEISLQIALFDAANSDISDILYPIPIRNNPHRAFDVSGYLTPGIYYFRVTSTVSSHQAYAIHFLVAAEQELLTRCVAADSSVEDVLYGCQWHLNNTHQFSGGAGFDINAEEAWETTLGEGVNVAIVDDGMHYAHRDLRDNVDESRNHAYYGSDVFHASESHGTEVAGLVAARDNSLGMRGVAPRATIYAYDLIAFGFEADDEQDAMIRNLEATGVSSNSWGFEDDGLPHSASTTWLSSIEKGLAEGYGGKGISYVWAAGNGNEETDDSNLDGRANHHGVIAVCAIDYTDTRSYNSEPGANLWVCAPSSGGEAAPGIATTTHGAYITDFSGTSAAAPIVSGVVALMRSVNPALTWRDVKLVLAASARKNDPDNSGWEEGALRYGSTTERYSFNHEYGFGMVDAAAAVDLAAAAVDLADGWTNAPAMRTTTARYQGESFSIPDAPEIGTPATITRTLTVDNYVEFTEFVEIKIDIDHASFRDLEIDLVSPSGAVSRLTTEGEGFFFFFFFAIPAPSPLNETFRMGSARHLGEDPAGEWQLRVTDRVTGHTGRIDWWSLTIYGHGSAPGYPEIGSLATGEGSLMIDWKAPVDIGASDITSYDLRHILSTALDKSDSNWTEVAGIWQTGNLTYTLTGLEAGAWYDVQVRAVNDSGAGPWSETESKGTAVVKPVAPIITLVAPRYQELGVVWREPTFTGGAPISAYDLRHIRSDATDKNVDESWTYSLNPQSVIADDLRRYHIPNLENGVSYDVQARATNSAGDSPWSSTVTGTPNRQNTDPEFPESESGARSLPENTAVDSAVGDPVTATDADSGALTYSLSSASEYFSLNSATGQLQVTRLLDYEVATTRTHTLTVNVTDGRDIHGDVDNTIDDTLEVTVTVEDVNEGFIVSGPDHISREENTTGVLGTFTAIDPEGSPLAWSVEGVDYGAMRITARGELSFNVPADYDQPADMQGANLYHIEVIAEDELNESALPVTIQVTNVDEAPVLSGEAHVTLEENSGVFVGCYGATDPEEAEVTWKALSGLDWSKFELTDGTDPCTRELRFKEPPDFDARADSNRDNRYQVTLNTSDKASAGKPGSLAVTVTLTDVDEPPVITGPASVDFDENATGAVATYSATDPEAGTVILSLTGTDTDAFSFTNGVLRFDSAPNFEDPDDAGGNNTYEVTVEARDALDTATQDVTVNVANVDEAGMLTLGARRGVNGKALVATLTDPDIVATQTWQWQHSMSTSGPWTDIANTDASSYTPTAADVGNYLRASVSYTDGAGPDETTLTADTEFLTLNDALTNQPPTPPDPLPQVADVAENAPAGRNVVQVVFTDPEGEQQLTYSLSGSDEFAIGSGSGRITVKSGELNYEETTSYSVTVSAADSFGAADMVTLTIGISDVDEPPEITLASAAGVTVSGSAVSVDENHAGDLVNVTATDPESTHTDYTLVLGGTHATSFTLNSTGATGVLSFTNPPDHEVREVYNLTLTASNASESSTLNVTVTVGDVNEPPGITLASAAGGAVTVSGSAVSVEENHTSDLVNVTATDPETTHTDYTLALGGTHSGSFTLNSTGGAGVLSFTNPPDHEVREVYRLTLTASNASESSTLDVTVTVRDVDEPPGITLASAAGGDVTVSGSAVSVEENHTSDLVNVTATDPETTHTDYTLLLGGTHSTSFTLNSTGGAGVLSFTNPPDHEVREVYRLTLTASNASESSTLNVTVTVGDVNEPPVISGATEVSLNEVVDPAPGQVVRVDTYTKSDPDRRPPQTTNWGPVGSSQVLSGADRDTFEFDQLTGMLTFASPPDYENGGGRYRVTLTANDGADPGTLDVTVNVANVEEAGTLALGARRGVNGEALVATLTDPDNVVSETWQWQHSMSRSGPWTDIANTDSNSYTPGADDVDNYLRASVSYTDGAGPDETTLTADTEFPTLNDASSNEPPNPPDPLPQVADVAENAPAGRNVVQVVFTDPEGEQQLTYSLSGSDEFAIGSGSGRITVKSGELNYEEATSHSVTVRAEDSFGAAGMVTLRIGISDVNEAPTAADFVVTVPEDATVDIDVVAMASDEDAADTLTVAGVERHPEAGTVAVNVGTNDITYTPRANYHGSDNFTYQVKDGAGLSSNIATVAITIDPVNDAPTFASPTTTRTRSVSESARAGDDVGERVTATDIDAGDSLAYSLFGTDAASFEIDSNGQITVASGTTFVITTQDTYMVTVTADDGSGETNATATVDVTIMVVTGPVVVVPPPSGGGGGGGGGFGGGGFAGGGGGGGSSGPSPSVVDFEWNVTRDIEDLDSAHDKPSGHWSDGTTLWILENGDGADDAVYAYDLATGERVEGREFALDDTNRAPRGVWSDRTVLWVSDSGRNSLFAHNLEAGERLPERDIALAARNRAARGIWSADETMWVLDGGKDALFAYDLESGALLAEYELVSANGDPHGLWSDGVTVWVSDHGAKRLFAYRLPARPDAPAAEDADRQDLERVRDEEFPNTVLSRASNNSPRGLWSDGDVMYVVDASDGKVYTYNMPDAIDARLASLSLSGVDIGEFTSDQPEYEGVVDDGVTMTTVEAAAVQDDAVVVIDPPDADEAAEGRQVTLAGTGEITVTVTSADGSRTKTYRVALAEPGPSASCLRGAIAVGFNLVVSEGGSIDDLATCAESRNVTALYTLDGGEYVSYILGAPAPVNEGFVALYADGTPALTPLIAKSEGPPSPAPESDAVPQFGPDCLRGEIVEGFNLVLSEGGSIDDLEACAEGAGLAALYALDDGVWVSYILGAPELVNAAFRELFPDGLPVATPLVGRSN